MKKSDSIVLRTAAFGVVVGVAVWVAWPDTPWWIYVSIALGTLIGIPKAIKNEADHLVAKKILDE